MTIHIQYLLKYFDSFCNVSSALPLQVRSQRSQLRPRSLSRQVRPTVTSTLSGYPEVPCSLSKKHLAVTRRAPDSERANDPMLPQAQTLNSSLQHVVIPPERNASFCIRYYVLILMANTTIYLNKF